MVVAAEGEVLAVAVVGHSLTLAAGRFVRSAMLALMLCGSFAAWHLSSSSSSSSSSRSSSSSSSSSRSRGKSSSSSSSSSSRSSSSSSSSSSCHQMHDSVPPYRYHST